MAERQKECSGDPGGEAGCIVLLFLGSLGLGLWLSNKGDEEGYSFWMTTAVVAGLMLVFVGVLKLVVWMFGD